MKQSSDALVLLLAGGIGSRLNLLVSRRAKPAVPFGGLYRIIDFSLSNVMNSGFTKVGVLTQYKPLSLMSHIGNGEAWDFTGRTRGVKILPPRTGEQDSDWYQGTADAIRQNIDFIENNPSEQVVVLSGDHIYRMDFDAMVSYHQHKKADITIGMMVVPKRDIHEFGTGIINADNRIIDGTVRNSILFPGVHVMAGAEVNDSILFFDTIVHENAQLHRMVSDVNTVFNRNVTVGRPRCEEVNRVSVIGWNNSVPEGYRIGCGCTVAPRIDPDRWPATQLVDGEELK